MATPRHRGRRDSRNRQSGPGAARGAGGQVGGAARRGPARGPAPGQETGWSGKTLALAGLTERLRVPVAVLGRLSAHAALTVLGRLSAHAALTVLGCWSVHSALAVRPPWMREAWPRGQSRFLLSFLIQS
uniref:Uncharacterized protein n=1 Tax=Myotis myotis TaxID=51298 RepID=A0A7J7T604_MYOMY|nr:hypothetical protein mMyoMyo1_009194 [Myotis myotis]